MEIREIRKLVRKAVNAPKYNPNKWKHAINSGCYPYAVNLFINNFLLIGSIIGKPCNYRTTDEKLVNTLIEELNYIGYNVKSIRIEDRIKEGELKIYLQRERMTGYYHFLRQDADGNWSHKYPGEIPIVEKNFKADINISGWCFCLSKKVS